MAILVHEEDQVAIDSWQRTKNQQQERKNRGVNSGGRTISCSWVLLLVTFLIVLIAAGATVGGLFAAGELGGAKIISSASQTTTRPSKSPSASPTTTRPSKSPSASPTTTRPSKSPSASPTTSKPSKSPSKSPTTSSPSRTPSKSPTVAPVTYGIATGTTTTAIATTIGTVLNLESAIGPITYDNNTGCFTCPSSGIYWVAYQAEFAANTAGSRLITGVLSSYGNYLSSIRVKPSAVGNTGIGASEIISCPSGSTISVMVNQSSGGNLNIISTDSPTRLNVVKLDSSKPYGLVRGNGAVQSIPTASETLLTTYWGTPTTTTGVSFAGGLYTVTSNGLYLITYSMCFGSSSAGTQRLSYVIRSGDGYKFMLIETTQSPDEPTCFAASTLSTLTASQTVGVRVAQDTGAALNTDTRFNQAFTIIQLDDTKPYGVSLSTTQSIPSGTQTTLIGYWNSVTTANGVSYSSSTGAFTASVGGTYMVTVHVVYVNAAGGERRLYLYQSSAPSVAVGYSELTPAIPSGADTGLAIQALVNLAAGESVYAQTYQSTGAALMVQAGFGSFGIAKVT